MKKIVVGVLMGGRSIEREVSFNSGRTICDHLDSAQYEVIPIFQREDGSLFILPWRFLHRGKTIDFVARLERQAQKISWDSLRGWIDFVYIAVHGRYAEDGTLQGILEILQIPYLGAKVFASALRIDKARHKEFLKLNNINVPRWLVISHTQIDYFKTHPEILQVRLEEHALQFPCVVKPRSEGSSLGVKVIHSLQELLESLHEISWVDVRKQQDILVEEKISGMEFTCIILEKRETQELFALPPTEVVPEVGTDFYDYDQKYMPGRGIKITPARIAPDQIEQIQQVCIRAMKVLELKTIARIDGFLQPDGKIVIIDPNSLSGTDPASFLFRQAAEIGMNHTYVINHLIATELRSYTMETTSMNIDANKEKIARLRVAVLLGGDTNEREVSLETGRNVVYKLSPQLYEAIPIFVTESRELYRLDQRLLVRHSTQEIFEGLHEGIKIGWSDLPLIADFVFIGLHGGIGENGSVQGALEMLGVPYNGSSVLASALCMDKFKTAQFLRARGFSVPRGFLIEQDEWQRDNEEIFAKIEAKIGFPCIIKPYDDGCSVLVEKITTNDQAKQAIEAILCRGKSAALVEEYLQGIELTVGVVGNNKAYALPPSQTVSQADILSIEEKFLPGAGENRTPAPLSSDHLQFVRTTMQEAYQALGCKGYVRIDCFFQLAEHEGSTTPRIVILEVNTLPALTPATCLFHQAAEMGLRPMELIDCIVQLGLQEHGRAYSLTLPFFTEATVASADQENLF